MKISVVVVTYNSIDHIADCLDSVLAQGYQNLEIIAVDNGSCDGTAAFISHNYPGVKLIRNDSNEGASSARNKGIEESSGDWILTLDSDTELGDNFIAFFRAAVESQPSNTGMVAAKILSSDGQTVYSLGNKLTFLRRFFDIAKGERQDNRAENPSDIFGACSAAAFYRKTMLEDIREKRGYFDPLFFFMAEDVDLAWRARKRGWGVYLCGDCVAYHDGGGSKTPERKKQFYSIRNRFLMIFKNDSFFCFALRLIPFIAYEFCRVIFLSIKGMGGVYFSACSSALAFLKEEGMKKSAVVVLCIFGIGLMYMPLSVFGIEQYRDEDEEARAYNVTRTVKTVDGLHFQVEEDRPIEKIAGVYRPIDLDSYIALKFNKLQKSMEIMSQYFQDKIDQLNLKIEALTEKVDMLASKASEDQEDAAKNEKPAPKQ